MKLLIVGAKGMLGTALVETFPAAVAWDRDEVDITQAEATAEKVADLGPQVIINAAAYTDVDGAEEEQQQAFLVNEVGVRNLAQAAKAAGATLVHYSTDYVFPGDSEKGYQEGDKPGPAVNVYGESKLAGEHELAKSEVDFFLLRTAWLYGPNGKNFVDTMLRLSQDRDELNVIDDQYGSPTYTKDLAAATKELLEGDFDRGTYHLVNEGRTTWCQFARKIFELSDVTMKVNAISTAEYPLPARRPKYSALINKKGPRLRAWDVALGEYLSLAAVDAR